MGTYATLAAFRAAVPGMAAQPDAAVTAALTAAERDVDELLGPFAALPATGLKLDPGSLLAWQATALARATSVQAAHLLAVGQAQADTARVVKSVKGPDFEKTYESAAATVPSTLGRRYSPLLRRELAPLAAFRRSGGRAAP
ncbi:MAG: hypothetical protein WKF96_00150 [Solirubrobacteraceae bacterium]